MTKLKIENDELEIGANGTDRTDRTDPSDRTDAETTNAPSPQPSPPVWEREKSQAARIDRAWMRLWRRLTWPACAMFLAGCALTPQTTIEGTLNGSPFVIKAPKDGELKGFDLTAESNGVLRVHIEQLKVRMNPEVIGQSAVAQKEMIQAAGEAAAGITAAAVREAKKN